MSLLTRVGTIFSGFLFQMRGFTRHAFVLLVTGLFMFPAHAEKGINGGELYRLAPTELAATVDGYKKLGVKWVRFDFDWSVMQPAPLVYDLAGHDRAVAALTAAQIKVLGIIAYTPAWASGGQPSKHYPPVDAKAYAEFAAFLAKRYGRLGVSAWEIWNEPNLAQFWGPAADSRAYTHLLKLAYAAIKKQNLKAIVISGGLAQPGTSGGNVAARAFLEQMYASGAGPYFDAVGNHPYTAPQLPLDSTGNNWQQMYSTTPSNLRGIMAKNGDSKKKIWITEYGAPTAGVSVWGTTVSEGQQAKMVSQSLALAASYSWSGPLFWYNYKDYCGPGTADSECYYGIVRFDGTAKPAFDAFRTAP